MKQQNIFGQEQSEGLLPFYEGLDKIVNLSSLSESCEGINKVESFLQQTSSDKFNLTGCSKSEAIPFNDHLFQLAAQNSLKQNSVAYRISSYSEKFGEKYYSSSLGQGALQPLTFSRENKAHEQNKFIRMQEAKHNRSLIDSECSELISDYPFNSNQSLKPFDSFYMEEYTKQNSKNILKDMSSAQIYNQRMNSFNSFVFPFEQQQPTLLEKDKSINELQILVQDMPNEIDQHSESHNIPLNEDMNAKQDQIREKKDKNSQDLQKKRRASKRQAEKITKRLKVEMNIAADSTQQEQLEDTGLPIEEEEINKKLIKKQEQKIAPNQKDKPVFQEEQMEQDKEESEICKESNAPSLQKEDSSKTYNEVREKTKTRSSRQSQHKNVYKNFGKELLRFVKAKKETNSILSESEYNQLIDNLTGGLNEKDTKKTLPIQKKEQLQVLWSINEFSSNNSNQQKSAQKEEFDLDSFQIKDSDSEAIRIKKHFKALSWDFFSDHAFLYVMTSRKLDKKEIHLKCIRSFLEGILYPKSLESFRPI